MYAVKMVKLLQAIRFRVFGRLRFVIVNEQGFVRSTSRHLVSNNFSSLTVQKFEDEKNEKFICS